ncbi:MAG: hypothetical protein ABI759_04115 [Candidatus Solibacter sp.]
MRIHSYLKSIGAAGVVACVLSSHAFGAVIVNGGFEAGFSGWSRADQLGSDGTFALQTGIVSPVNGDPVPSPSGPATAAMSDAQGPGAHALYQDFTIPTPVAAGTMLTFDLFIGNRNTAFFSPATLDFSTPALNQQARVDILLAGTDPLSVGSSDVLLNVFQTNPGDPLVSGYATHSIDITALLNAHVGTALRLRFAEVDNVAAFQLGVDQVDIVTGAAAGVPEPASWLLAASALALLSARRRLGGRA